MKNLIALLNLKKQKSEFVVQSENGIYIPMTTGSKGVVKNVDHAISQELFGEYPLSEDNYSNFVQLTKLKLQKVKKPIEAKDLKPKIAKMA